MLPGLAVFKPTARPASGREGFCQSPRLVVKPVKYAVQIHHVEVPSGNCDKSSAPIRAEVSVVCLRRNDLDALGQRIDADDPAMWPW
jgi:hypothetical protein